MAQLMPPKRGVTIRMYRQGHGDCFLLAMPKKDGTPFYLLIDCGAKPGSELSDAGVIIDDIREATNGFIDAVLITHEHQDHVNMFLARRTGEAKLVYDGIKFGSVILGWTANPDDKEAQALRREKQQALVRLVAARNGLAGLPATGDREVSDTLAFVDSMLEFEGVDAAAMEQITAMGFGIDGEVSLNFLSVAKAMDYVAGKVDSTRLRYMSPHQPPETLPGVSGIRLFALGPPRGDNWIDVDEPKETDKPGQDRLYERTHQDHGLSFGMGGNLEGLFAALNADLSPEAKASYEPFSSDQQLSPHDMVSGDTDYSYFFDHFLTQADRDWRNINVDWLGIAGWFADKINTELNNSSLVIAIELEKSRKILLFPGDAQYGSWMSWGEKTFDDAGTIVTAQDLLGRTVFYKVGHHGSHNATLKGKIDSPYANLDWMGMGPFARQFTAVIPANTKWAWDDGPKWEHPLAAIHTALKRKTQGRLFKSDSEFDKTRPDDVSAADWKAFLKRVTTDKLYFDYTVHDE